jgi:Skp family chaperone for outer membrane proteins
MKTSLLLAFLTLGVSPSFAQAPKPAAPPAAAPAVFPAGAKVAYVNLQAIASNSAEGKADNAKVETLVKKKQGEAPAAQKTPQDAQKFQQDAQAEVQKLQAELQNDFQRKLFPVLQQMAKDKQLSMLLSSQDAGLIWADPGLDLTAEAIKRLDAATAAPKPAAKK